MRLMCVLGKSPVPDTTGSRRRLLRLMQSAAGAADVDVHLVVVSSDMTPVERDALAHLDTPPAELIELARHPVPASHRARWAAGTTLPFGWLGVDLGAARGTLDTAIDVFRPDVMWFASALFATALMLRDDAGGTVAGGTVAGGTVTGGAIAGGTPMAVDVAHIEQHSIDSQLRSGVRTLRRQPFGVRRVGHLALDRRARVVTERKAFAASSLLTTCSDVEADAARGFAGGRTTVVPNGVDLPEALGWSPGSRRLLFIGNLGYASNAEAARRLATTILPRIRQVHPTCVLDIVGAGSAAVGQLARLDGVVVHDFVPDLTDLYARAELVVAPMLSGSGTKLKVLEAMAHGVPLVTTPTGIAGLDLAPGRHVAVADSTDGLVDHALRLMDAPDEARRQRDAARAWIEDGYTWDAIGRRFTDEMRSLAHTAPGRSA